jgi:hypothetical protein
MAIYLAGGPQKARAWSRFESPVGTARSDIVSAKNNEKLVVMIDSKNQQQIVCDYVNKWRPSCH